MADDGIPAVFWELHDGLPRQGPGDDACTRRAFEAVGALRSGARVVDAGCGPGMQTLALARLLGDVARILAVDNHAPFLAELDRRAADAGLAGRIETRVGDMAELPVDPGSVDLLWSEGAIYIIGFERGLTTWQPLLCPGGFVAVTEAIWLRPDPPGELRRFWDDGYPAMVDADGNARTAERCGYRVLERFTLPPEAWWTHYYDPLVERLPAFRERYAGDEQALAVLDGEQLEIELYRRYHAYYGYAFYVLQRDG